MKKIFYYIILSIVFVSCSDLLDEEPRDKMDPNQFFTSDAEAIGGVNGVYKWLNTFYGGGWGRDYGYWSHQGTDISRPTGGREGSFPFHVYTLSASNESNLREHWKNLYRAVGDANQVIARVSVSEGISAEVKARVVGEAKFLRGLYYYMLTNWWGDVPLWLDELNIEEVGGAIPRTPVAQVRDQIVLDLLDAEQSLPASYPATDIGRATKWAAKVLLAKVYLWQGDWAKAKATAGEVIQQSGGPHSLIPVYKDIFGVANEHNSESIFEIDYQVDINKAIRTSRYMPRTKDEPRSLNLPTAGFGLLTSTVEFIASFDPDDQRIEMYNWHGWNGIETNYHYVAKNMDWDSPRGNGDLNAIVFRLADAYLMYAEAENELNGPTADAYEKINTIRDRAFGNDPAKQLSGLSKEEFRTAIMNERKWELSFEYHRRWDLNRWGKLVEAVQSIAATNPDGAANVSDHHMLCPVPSQEISLNDALLPNNPGY